MSPQKQNRVSKCGGIVCAAIVGLIACSALTGCLVAGYSSNGGAFIWPGGLGLIFVLLVVLWFLLRRR